MMICLFLCWQMNTLWPLGANNPDFVALSNTIGILEGARNSVLSDGSDLILSAIPNRRQHRV